MSHASVSPYIIYGYLLDIENMWYGDGRSWYTLSKSEESVLIEDNKVGCKMQTLCLGQQLTVQLF